MNSRNFLFGGIVGLMLGLLGSVWMWRELHHTRARLLIFEEKEAKMEAHRERRQAFEDEQLTARANRSSRRLAHDES